MRNLLLLILLCITLFASPKEMVAFHSKFDQSITDDNGKTIRYSGELWAQKPQNALWVYTKPIQKSVYVNARKVTVLEPALEQATVRRLDDEIDFLRILSQSKRISDTEYAATINGVKYKIMLSDNIPVSIGYTDSFDNKIVIRFLNPELDKPVEPSKLLPKIPSGFDLIQG